MTKQMDVYQSDELDTTWEKKILLIGGVVGVAVGLGSAYLLIKNVEKTGKQPTLQPREGLKLAILLFGLVRNVANLWEE
jgi:hypothetical protein